MICTSKDAKLKGNKPRKNRSEISIGLGEIGVPRLFQKKKHFKN